LETLRVIELKKMPIFQMLALEEHLLEMPCENYLLINYGTPDAIVLGKSNDRIALVDEKVDVPLIRRFSGGGTVYVDHSTLFITWILSKELTSAKCVDTLFDWTVKTIKKTHPLLEFNRIETDYVIQDKKVGGTAQYVKKDRILHHTSFLFDYSKEKLSVLKQPLKAPAYRQNRSHEEFLTTLNTRFAIPEDFVHPYLVELEKEFFLEKTSILEILKTLKSPKQTVILESRGS
jgi:lipoate-protein ligase A